MSKATAPQRENPSRMKRALPWLGMGACLLILGAHIALDLLGKSRAGMAQAQSQAQPHAESEEAGKSGALDPSTTVSLSPAKLKAAKLTTAPARFDRLATELAVPGKVEVNSDRRVEIRPRATGVIREVHVVLGQSVKRGEPLVTLDSPDVGTARLNLRDRQRRLTTARIEAEWKSQVAGAVALLIPEIRKGTDPSAIEKEFADKPLGSYRGSLLQAYAEYDIAVHDEEKTAGLRTQEVIGEHPAVLARHNREGLQAKLYASIEQVNFDAAQEKRLADQRLRGAESDVIDAAQRLRILGVSENIRDLLDHADKANQLAVDEDVTIYQITSPFDGTIISKNAVPSQRAELVDILFTVADLSTVWVTANIAESDVASVPEIRGGAIKITATAYPDRVFTAALLSVGALVDSQTRTVPLLAQTENREGLLKPGMFVRIALNSPVTELTLTVPLSAVVEIEGKTGVFVPAGGAADRDASAGTFSFRPIQKGRDAGDRVVVKSGLKEGDVVVAGEAFQLKAELIHQGQGDED